MPIKVSGKTSRLPCVSTLVEEGNNLMLFDTGLFGQSDLISALRRLGFSATDVTHVFNTHFHGDHSGGNDLFEKTPKIASLREFRFSLNWLIDFTGAEDKFAFMKGYFPYLADAVIVDRRDSLVEHSKRVMEKWRSIEGGFPTEAGVKSDGYLWIEEGADIPECVTPVETPGHTKHHTSYIVKGDVTNLIIAGDAISRRMTAFDEDILDEPHIDLTAHRESARKLLSIPGFVVPGHDRPFGNFKKGDLKVKIGKRMEF
jgi:glyoxylase-like metal-dependent hydrolase (beta-lactamase superfamily II)